MRLFVFFSIALFTLAACTNNSPERDQQLTENWGANLFKTRCANCHQENGSGLGELYPPLANSDFLTDANRSKVICLIKNGYTGQLVVNKKTYNQPMPANTDMSDEAIAAISTYIYKQFAQKNIEIIPLEVQQTLSECK